MFRVAFPLPRLALPRAVSVSTASATTACTTPAALGVALALRRTCTNIRCFASRPVPRSSSPASGSASASALVQVIDQEVSDVLTGLNSKRDNELKGFIREFKYNVQVSADGSRITATRRTEQGVQITVEFPTLADETEDDEYVSESEQVDEDENDEEQGEQEQEEGEEHDDLETQKPHYFHIDIQNRAGSFLRLFCLATPQQKLDIYQVAFDKQSADLASSDSSDPASEVALLNWEDLGDEVASGFADYLHDDLNIDDDLASFVQAYSQNVRADQYVAKIKQLKHFLQTTA